MYRTSRPVSRRAPGAVSPPKPEGRRDLKKREKAARIRAAATSLFHKRGYRETTVQAIAEAAKVGMGTLFLYAADKRELLLQIINDELDILTADAFSSVDREATVIDQILQVLRPRYSYWGVDPGLSLAALQEVMVMQPGDENPESQYARYQRRRLGEVTELRDLFAEQQRRGRIRRNASSAVLAELCMLVHPSFLRNWLRQPAPDVQHAMAELRELLIVALGSSLVRKL